MTSVFLSLDVASSLVVQGSDAGDCRVMLALRYIGESSLLAGSWLSRNTCRRVTCFLLAGSQTSVLN